MLGAVCSNIVQTQPAQPASYRFQHTAILADRARLACRSVRVDTVAAVHYPNLQFRILAAHLRYRTPVIRPFESRIASPGQNTSGRFDTAAATKPLTM